MDGVILKETAEINNSPRLRLLLTQDSPMPNKASLGMA